MQDPVVDQQPNLDHTHPFHYSWMAHYVLKSAERFCADIDPDKLDEKLRADSVEFPACESDILDISGAPVVTSPFFLTLAAAGRSRCVMDLLEDLQDDFIRQFQQMFARILDHDSFPLKSFLLEICNHAGSNHCYCCFE